MSGKRYHVTTFGCQMNEHDSERMKGMLESLGYARGGRARRGRPDPLQHLLDPRGRRQPLHRPPRRGQAAQVRGPRAVVGVGGCWAQSVKDEVFERFPFVDVAFGPGQIGRLAEFLASDSITAQGYFEFEDFAGHLPMKREREFQAWLQISQGCNCRCSYCIVPSTRGREQSRDPAELVAEVEALAADGVREVTLLGQNVNSYGRDLPRERRTSFAELLGRIDAVDGIERIRYTSPHPKDMREDVIRAHAELPALCEHIHLPLQSGSSRILKAMRRTYNRRALPRPGGADPRARARLRADHRHHRRLPGRDRGRLRRDAGAGRGGRATTAPSPSSSRRAAAPRRRRSATRSRTRSSASGWSGWSRRSSGARASARSASSAATMEVLVEGNARRDPSQLRGRTRHNKAVNFEGTAAPGELVEVEIASATSQTLTGHERLLSRA